jgi:hypothetical protein
MPPPLQHTNTNLLSPQIVLIAYPLVSSLPELEASVSLHEKKPLSESLSSFAVDHLAQCERHHDTDAILPVHLVGDRKMAGELVITTMPIDDTHSRKSDCGACYTAKVTAVANGLAKLGNAIARTAATTKSHQESIWDPAGGVFMAEFSPAPAGLGAATIVEEQVTSLTHAHLTPTYEKGQTDTNRGAQT